MKNKLYPLSQDQRLSRDQRRLSGRPVVGGSRARNLLHKLRRPLRSSSAYLFTILIFSAPLALADANPSRLSRASFQNVSGNLELDRDIWTRRTEMLWGALSNLWYLNSGEAVQAYQEFESIGVSRAHVARSLFRFFELLLTAKNYEEFGKSLEKEFVLYRSPGHDGNGNVLFTAYFRPVYKASKIKSAQFRFPIFKKPRDFESWKLPHPTRVQLEGYQGLGGKGTNLNGLELAWLGSRYEAFMIHLQGSAILEFQDGSRSAIGFDAGTKHPFRGVSKNFLQQHKIRWDRLGEFFSEHPNELDGILARNNRFIFFKERQISEPIGSLGVPIIGERSIATDKLKLPPGALGIIKTKIPVKDEDGGLKVTLASRIVFDHDTGSAIKGPGRVDLYMGTGSDAMRKASSVYGSGELFYLFLREGLYASANG